MCWARPEDWAGLCRRRDAFPMDILLFSVPISWNSKGCSRVYTYAERDFWYHGDGEISWYKRHESTAMTRYSIRQTTYWSAAESYESTLVDDDQDQDVDNVVEVFRQACAEAFAQITDYCMIHKLRLYAAFIVDSTPIICVILSVCGSPADAIAAQSVGWLWRHINLCKGGYPWRNEVEHIMNSSAICPLEMLIKLSQASQLYKNQNKTGPRSIHISWWAA